MKIKKVAIVADHFSESSLCLAKYIAQKGVYVDYYRFSGLNDNGIAFAFEYPKVSKFFLYHKKVKMSDIPELEPYFKGLPFQLHLIRLSSQYRKIPGLFKFAYRRIVNMLSEEGYDVINLVGGNRMEVFHSEPRLKKIVHSLHEVGTHYEQASSTPLLAAIIKDETPVLFFSESTRLRFLEIKGAEKCKTNVVPFGKFETTLLYDNNMQIETNLDLAKTTFLFFGFIRPFKGLDILAKAVSHLQEQSMPFNLIIAGSGDDPNLLFFKNQANCFVLNKTVSNQELNSIFKMSHCVVMPYKSASQTGIAPTAYLFGKPIIASKVGALPDVVKHMKNGLLVEPNNAIVLAEAMQLIIEDKELLSSLSQGTSAYGKGDIFDWNIIAENTISFFNDVVCNFKSKN